MTETENRDFYARVPDPLGNGIRVNSPDGFLSDFPPVPWGSDADLAQPGVWWVGSDQQQYQGGWGGWGGYGGQAYGPIGPAGPAYGPRRPTEGSPLTEEMRRPLRGGPGALLPAVTRCTTVLVEAVVRTRWAYQSPDGATQPRPLWVDDPMLMGRSPGVIGPLAPAGRRIGGHQFFSSLMADALLYGQGGLVFIENEQGAPVPGSLMLLNPFMFEVDPSDGHILLDRFDDDPLRTDFDGRFQMGGQRWRVAVLHGLYPSHDGWPEGVLSRHFETFRIGAKLGRYLESTFHSGVPQGYLSVSQPNYGGRMVADPDAPGQEIEEQELLKRNWQRAHGTGRRSTAVLNSTVTYTPIALDPVSSDSAKLAAVNRQDIAHAFGISSIWLDEGAGGLNYSNSSERRADLVAMTAAGWGERMTDLISSLLPYGWTVGVNWPSFISPSIESIMPSLVQAVQTGILTAAEARQLIGTDPWTGPDRAFRDVSKAAGGQEPAAPAPDPIQGDEEEDPDAN